jgi:branched-chain amino acid transport system ATP-binding protein
MELVTKIRDKGITIFMIEHVMKAIMSICDRIIVLHHGEKIAEGTPQEITSNQTVIEVYLGKSS